MVSQGEALKEALDTISIPTLAVEDERKLALIRQAARRQVKAPQIWWCKPHNIGFAMSEGETTTYCEFSEDTHYGEDCEVSVKLLLNLPEGSEA